VGRVEIVSPSVSEWKVLKALRLDALKRDPQAFGSSYERELAYPDEKWQQRLRGTAEGDSYVFIAKWDGRPVGMVMGGRTDEDRSRHSAHIWGLYVDGSARRRGIARALMEKVVTGFATNHDVRVVKVEVNPQQEAALRLYLSLGFEETGTSKWKMGDGLEHKVTSLEKRLP
jgi:ribosomal protein S18 acetylase RimI-like enzyme